MLRSLRLRLVLLLVVPVLVAGGLSLILASQRIASYESQAANRAAEKLLRSESLGVAQVYGEQAYSFFTQTAAPPQLNQPLRQITSLAGIFYVPNPDTSSPCEKCGLATWGAFATRLSAAQWRILKQGGQLTLSASPPHMPRSLIVVTGVWQTPDGTRVPPQSPIGAVVLARPLTHLAPNEGFFARQLAPAVLVGVGAAMLLGAIFGFRIVWPLRRLATASERIARGHFDVQLDGRRRDEIGQLNRAFAIMADELHSARELQRQFLMRVSHELRTPLTAIEGHIGALADGIYETAAERDHAYGVLAAEAMRLERLISDLLDLSKLEARGFAFRREAVDLDSLLDQCLAGLSEAARSASIDLTADHAQLGVVVGDGDRILQVVSNLIENALNWTPAGGVVRVSGTSRPGVVEISVADSGPGIPLAKRQKVFQPFYSEGPSGTGLGLAIAAELASAMGGTLHLGDAAEGGARFTLTVPRRSAAARSDATPTPVV
jgi:two-component system, OmpR family, sensor kinase